MQLNPNALIADIALCAGISKRSVYRIIKEYQENHALISLKRTKERPTLLSKIDDWNHSLEKEVFTNHLIFEGREQKDTFFRWDMHKPWPHKEQGVDRPDRKVS